MKYCKIRILLFAFLALLITNNSSFSLQVEDLQGNALDAIGLEKTLPFTAWGDIPFEQLKEITLSLSAQKKSAVLQNLTAQVLVQPTFITSTSWTKKQSVEWLETRLQALLNMGKAEQVLQMISKVPVSAVTINVLKIKADALLLIDNWPKACIIAVQNADKDEYLSLMQMFCLSLMGEKDRALLAFDLWRETHEEENMPSFIMGQLMEMPVLQPKEVKNLTVAEAYVLLQLKSPLLEKVVLPLSYQYLSERRLSSFGNAINVEKLLQVWKKGNLSEEEQAYRFYLLTSYADLFLPDLRFVRKNILWEHPLTKQNLLLTSVFLKDKPETQITGSDLLLGLWLISQNSIDLQRVLLLLDKGGLSLEPFVLEQINP